MVMWIIFWAKTTYDVGYKSFVDERKQADGVEGAVQGVKNSRKTRETGSGGARRRSTRRRT